MCMVTTINFVVAVIVWLLDITTDVVSSNLDQGEVYNIM